MKRDVVALKAKGLPADNMAGYHSYPRSPVGRDLCCAPTRLVDKLKSNCYRERSVAVQLLPIACCLYQQYYTFEINMEAYSFQRFIVSMFA